MIPIVASLIEAGLGILGGAVASKGKDLIQEKFGINIENMLGSPEGKLELLKVQSAHEEALIRLSIESKQQELEHEKLAQANTDGARNMQIAALAQNDLFAKRYVYHLSSGAGIFSVLYIAAITFLPIPSDNIRFADTILGFLLGTLMATVINYFFGSSRQSQAKDSALADAIKGMKQ